MPTTINAKAVLALRTTNWVFQATSVAGNAPLRVSVGGVVQSSLVSGGAALAISSQASVMSSGINASGHIALHITKPAVWPDTGESPAWEVNTEQFSYATISIQVPAPSLQLWGQDGALGSLLISVPPPLVSFTGSDGALGQFSITVPKPALSLSGVVGATGSMRLSLPPPRINLWGLPGEVGTLSIPVPMLKFDLSGNLSAEGTLTIVVPAPRFHGRITMAEYLNMVLNIRNLALTEYANYDFNSLCRFKGKHLGADSANIYDLDSGDDDNGTLIDWNFRFGYLDLEQKLKKRICQAWMSYKSDGDLIATIITPAGDAWEYPVNAVNNTENGIKIVFGRGIKSKYISLDIKNVDGSSLDLDTIRLQYDQFQKKR